MLTPEQEEALAKIADQAIIDNKDAEARQEAIDIKQGIKQAKPAEEVTVDGA